MSSNSSGNLFALSERELCLSLCLFQTRIFESETRGSIHFSNRAMLDSIAYARRGCCCCFRAMASSDPHPSVGLRRRTVRRGSFSFALAVYMLREEYPILNARGPETLR
jgi:hypothetical protein